MHCISYQNRAPPSVTTTDNFISPRNYRRCDGGGCGADGCDDVNDDHDSMRFHDDDEDDFTSPRNYHHCDGGGYGADGSDDVNDDHDPMRFYEARRAPARTVCPGAEAPGHLLHRPGVEAPARHL